MRKMRKKNEDYDRNRSRNYAYYNSNTIGKPMKIMNNKAFNDIRNWIEDENIKSGKPSLDINVKPVKSKE